MAVEDETSFRADNWWCSSISACIASRVGSAVRSFRHRFDDWTLHSNILSLPSLLSQDPRPGRLVQFQRVLANLIINATEAMRGAEKDRER
jgi:hypothetical protein